LSACDLLDILSTRDLNAIPKLLLGPFPRGIFDSPASAPPPPIPIP